MSVQGHRAGFKPRSAKFPRPCALCLQCRTCTIIGTSVSLTANLLHEYICENNLYPNSAGSTQVQWFHFHCSSSGHGRGLHGLSEPAGTRNYTRRLVANKGVGEGMHWKTQPERSVPCDPELANFSKHEIHASSVFPLNSTPRSLF